MTRIVESMPRLRVLYVDNNNISETIMEEIVRNYENLCYISAKGIFKTEDTIKSIKMMLMERGGYFWNWFDNFAWINLNIKMYLI